MNHKNREDSTFRVAKKVASFELKDQNIQSENYFLHHNNARNDLRVQNMRSEHGDAGYGRLMIILELMADNGGFLSKEGPLWCNGIASQMDCDKLECEKFIRECIRTYRIFESNGSSFWLIEEPNKDYCEKINIS